ncbi:MAG: PEP-CTERM sorting domain-containing protein [Planctomycetia bacterium]|nr:PEP-CTERM sorting domain-containing protein [Planctomycetia bacterium]
MKKHNFRYTYALFLGLTVTGGSFCAQSVLAQDNFTWQNDSGNWTDVNWLKDDLTTLQTTVPGASDSAYVTAGNVTVGATATVKNLTISGTGNVTVNSEATGYNQSVLSVADTLDVQTNATLTFAKGSQTYNHIGANTTLTGNGTIINTGGNTSITSTNTDGFNGTIKIQGGQVWVKGSTLKNATISLDGGDLRNCEAGNGTFNIDSNIVINSNDGGVRAGWTNLCVNLNGVISDGATNTLTIKNDSNDTHWVVLTNKNNTFTNLKTEPQGGGQYTAKVRITDVGALGDMSGKITNEEYLDLYGLSNSTDGGTTIKKVEGSGYVVNNKSNTTATLYIKGMNSSVNVVDSYNKNNRETVENAKMAVVVTAAGDIRYLTAGNSNYTGGLTITEGVVGSNRGSNFGYGDITLGNGATLFNNNYSVEVFGDVILSGDTGSLRSGWKDQRAAMNVSGDISGNGMLNLHYGEGGPSVIMLSGNNTYTGGTKFHSTGRANLIINTNSAFGTGVFNTTDANTTLDFNTGGTWGYAAYNSRSQEDVAIWGFDYDLEKRTVTAGNSGYITEVTATKDGTLTFARSDKDGHVFITDLETGERTAVLYSSDSVLSATYDFKAGKNYRIDVRYESGVSTALTVSENADGSNAQTLAINQDGSWKGISTITSMAKNWTVATPFNIGDKTLTLTNTGIGSGTFSGNVTGTGTVEFDGERNGGLGTGLMAFDGTSASDADKFNVSIADNTRFTGNGTVSGNLSFAGNDELYLSATQGDLTVLGDLNLNGDLEIVMDLTDISTDMNWGTLAESSSVTGWNADNLKFTFVGDASGIDNVITLTVFEGTDFSDTLSLEDVNVNFSAVADSLIVNPIWTDNGVMFQVGSHSALPEPATWVLIALAIPGLAYLRRSRQR